MQSKVQRWGNSLAVRIPRAFAQGIGLEEDSAVEISVNGTDLVISRITPRPFTLDGLLPAARLPASPCVQPRRGASGPDCRRSVKFLRLGQVFCRPFGAF
jgi:antitoxin MazE